MERRTFLSSLGLGLGAVALPTVPAAATPAREGATAAAVAGAQWPGHRPGRIYLGMSCPGSISTAEAKTGRVGLNRTFSRWGNASGETNVIRTDHVAGRLPWISFKPPSHTSGIWSAIASGRYDGDVRERARRFAGYSAPVVVTFNHEPQTDASIGSPAQFAAAWTRIYDVWDDETAMENTAFAPIIGEWVFNPVNRGDEPEPYLPEAVLRRMAFLGIDLYQNPSGDGYSERLGRIVDWLDDKGHGDKAVGVGETGCTNAYAGEAADWWKKSWSWAASHAARVCAISYFNSGRNSRSGVNWELTESTDKLNAYRASLSSSVACRLT